MAKQVQITEKLKATIRASIGDPEFDVGNLAVFEARMLSTEPISQKGFHDGARVARSTLSEMAAYVNKEGTNVPLQIMHNRQVLPVGRVFSAMVRDLPNGESELRGQFYIPKEGEHKLGLIADIEASVIDEVSVGLLAKHAYCSNCDFDYFGEEAEFINILTMTCENNHTIGKDGVHLRLVGMDVFAELSLVGRGAAHGAKILSRAKHSLSQETVERLAASKLPADAYVLTASCKMDSSENHNQKGEKQMSIETKLAELATDLGVKTSELSQAQKTIEGLNSEIVSLKAEKETLTKKVADLEAAQGTEAKQLRADKEKAETELKAASEKLVPHVKAALVAAGTKEEEVPAEFSAMLKLVEEKGLKLHQVFGAGEGGSAAGTKDDVENRDDAGVRRKSNFKLN